MAGITINALTGSDSAPAKANEAEQKNDIGSAKDQISLTATNAKLSAYDTAYVGNGVSSTEAATTVGQAVIDAVLPYNGKKVGKASIEVEQLADRSAEITISTRDLEVVGTITLKDGVLTWGEIKEITPGIKLSDATLTIETGKTGVLTVSFKLIPNNTAVTWTSSDTTNKITVSNGNISVDSSVANNTTATITATVTYNGIDYTKTCIVTAKKREPISGVVGDYIPYDVAYKDINTNYNFVSTNGWRILDAEETGTAGEYKNVKIISTGIPAKLYYHYENNENNAKITSNTKPTWWGELNDVSSIYGSSAGFIYASNGYPNYYAAAGLLKKFSSIPLNGSSSKPNTGFAASTTNNAAAITNIDYKGLTGTTSEKTKTNLTTPDGSIFLTNYAEEVHNLTIEELNFARGLDSIVDFNTDPISKDAVGTSGTGLFYLKDLSGTYNYNSSTSCSYWLASPYGDSRLTLGYVHDNGTFLQLQVLPLRCASCSFSEI